MAVEYRVPQCKVRGNWSVSPDTLGNVGSKVRSRLHERLELVRAYIESGRIRELSPGT